MKTPYHFRTMAAIGLLLLKAYPSANAAQPDSPEHYQAATSDCTVDLYTKRKGRIIINGWLENFSLFSENSSTRAWAANIHFQCIKKDARQYCPSTWTAEVVEQDPIVLKRVGARRYDFQHPHYYSLVYASSFNNSEPPRSRDLYFCLGNETRTVVGHVPIGDEKKQFSTQALKIISTLQIQPTVNAQTRP